MSVSYQILVKVMTPGAPMGTQKTLILGYYSKSGIAAMFFDIQLSYLKISLPVTLSRIKKNFEAVNVITAPGRLKNNISR